MSDNLYKIAAGWNNIAGFAVWTSLQDSNGNKMPHIQSWGTYQPGQTIERGDGSLSFDGLPRIEWTVSFLLQSQYDYLRTTYCSGGYRGKVTIATRINSIIYGNYNAWFSLPTDYRVDRETGWIPELTMTLTRLKAV